MFFKKKHYSFLKSLQDLPPEKCKPIIITAAGFRNPWYKAVIQMRCDFIGRVRNSTYYFRINQDQWLPVKSLYQQATEKARFIGLVLLSRTTPMKCYFYLMRQKKTNRIKRNLVGKKVECSVSKKHARGAREPWLIASSLSDEEMSAADTMILYKKRMQIEEVFRDLKNTRNGLCLSHCRSFKVERLTVALLIGALAIFVLWIAGVCAKRRELHYSFQVNTVRSRNVCLILRLAGKY